jgi:hypothetical protein
MQWHYHPRHLGFLKFNKQLALDGKIPKKLAKVCQPSVMAASIEQ